jgi:hypothetical protein
MAKFYSASIKDPFKTAKATHGKKTIYIDLPNDQKKLREQHTIKCGHDIINRAIQASDLVFDDLEMNHHCTTFHWSDEGENSIRFISGYNVNVSSINLKEILKDIYIDSCEVPLSITL